MIMIIDYGASNLRSVVNAIRYFGYEPIVTSSPAEIRKAKAVVLPGVGAAWDTVCGLKEHRLDEVIRELVIENKPLFAICVGMQVLFTGTEEGGWHECLNIVPGKVKRLSAGLKVPHMGWNQVVQKKAHPIFNGIPDGANFYFVHSFYPEPEDKSIVAGTTQYGVNFCSIIAKDNLVATQFHPEKSGEYGLKMYSNFIKMALGK